MNKHIVKQSFIFLALPKILGLGFIAGMVACSSARYTQPTVPLTDQYRGQSDTVLSDSSENIAQIPYRDFFDNPELVRLIDSGISRNNNLLIAYKQLEQASEALKQAKWGDVPTVDLAIGPASITRPSDNSMNGMMAGQLLGSKYMEDYSASVSLSWEADIWGKIKGQKEAALASYLQTQEGTRAIQTRLITDIAQGYYNLVMLDLQLKIAHENLALADSTLAMTKLQRDWGLTNTLAVQQQESARDQLLSTIPVIKQNIVLQENVLSLLTGNLPSEIVRSKGLQQLRVPESLPTGIPAEMLGIRPDVRSSEYALRRAFAMEHVAKVNMYPALRITAQGGVNAFKASNWFDVPGSLFAMASGSIVQPILQKRQLKTAYRQAQLSTEQAELQFKESVLQAVGEVSSTLAQLEAQKDQAAVAERLAARYDTIVQNARLLFSNGAASYLEVIAAQNGKLQAELNLADVQRQRLSTVVTLYRALGGGWKP